MLRRIQKLSLPTILALVLALAPSTVLAAETEPPFRGWRISDVLSDSIGQIRALVDYLGGHIEPIGETQPENSGEDPVEPGTGDKTEPSPVEGPET